MILPQRLKASKVDQKTKNIGRSIFLGLQRDFPDEKPLMLSGLNLRESAGAVNPVIILGVPARLDLTSFSQSIADTVEELFPSTNLQADHQMAAKGLSVENLALNLPNEQVKPQDPDLQSPFRFEEPDHQARDQKASINSRGLSVTAAALSRKSRRQKRPEPSLPIDQNTGRALASFEDSLMALRQEVARQNSELNPQGSENIMVHASNPKPSSSPTVISSAVKQIFLGGRPKEIMPDYLSGSADEANKLTRITRKIGDLMGVNDGGSLQRTVQQSIQTSAGFMKNTSVTRSRINTDILLMPAQVKRRIGSPFVTSNQSQSGLPGKTSRPNLLTGLVTSLRATRGLTSVSRQQSKPVTGILSDWSNQFETPVTTVPSLEERVLNQFRQLEQEQKKKQTPPADWLFEE